MKSDLLPNSGNPHKYIDTNSRAYIEFFGPPTENCHYSQRVFDTFY